MLCSVSSRGRPSKACEASSPPEYQGEGHAELRGGEQGSQPAERRGGCRGEVLEGSLEIPGKRTRNSPGRSTLRWIPGGLQLPWGGARNNRTPGWGVDSRDVDVRGSVTESGTGATGRRRPASTAVAVIKVQDQPLLPQAPMAAQQPLRSLWGSSRRGGGGSRSF